MQIVSEVGTDLRQWPSKKHFTSWLKLAPGKNQSGKLKYEKISLERKFLSLQKQATKLNLKLTEIQAVT